MRPFLKWAGNKYQIVETIKKELPEGKRLIEPFVGSGALFINTDYPEYLVSDVNCDLIHLYNYVKNEGNDFVDYVRTFMIDTNNTPAEFYRLRDTFNTTTDRKEKAALFIYLNRHCFNGLCRYNSKGGFNVPFGKYKKPYFPEEEIMAFHEKAKKTTFLCEDFLKVMDAATKGDVVYCDPPYVPLSISSSFTSYSKEGFSLAQQQALADKANELAAKGIPVLISNHDTDYTRQIYSKAEKIIALSVQRYISANGNRDKAKEILAVFS